MHLISHQKTKTTNKKINQNRTLRLNYTEINYYCVIDCLVIKHQIIFTIFIFLKKKTKTKKSKEASPFFIFWRNDKSKNEE